jgi:hypothetical protein
MAASHQDWRLNLYEPFTGQSLHKPAFQHAGPRPQRVRSQFIEPVAFVPVQFGAQVLK